MLSTGDETSARRAYEILMNGGVIAFPTETVYGLGVRYGDFAATERLRQLKGRDAQKPFQILISGVAAAEQIAVLTPAARRILDAFWPGALTVVLPSRANPAETLGLRAPDHRWLQKLLKLLPEGVTATSANLAGEPPARDAAEAEAAIGDRVDLLLDGGPSRLGTASTVISLINDELKIFRQGSISEAALREFL